MNRLVTEDELLPFEVSTSYVARLRNFPQFHRWNSTETLGNKSKTKGVLICFISTEKVHLTYINKIYNLL